MAGPWEKYQTDAGPWSKYAAPKETSTLGTIAGGLLRGAGSIGATIARPFESAEENEARRVRLDENARNLLNADTESWLYKGSKIGAEIAGTAGIGPALAAPLAALKVAPALTSALQTGGMSAGGATGLGGLLARLTGGAATGAASAAAVDPQDARMGAIVGAALPAGAMALGKGAQAVGRSLRGAPVAPEVRALYERAGALGIDVPADRIVNSKPLNAMAASLNYVPFSGRAATEQKMAEQMNRAVSRTFGQDSSNVTKALDTASKELGAKFDDVLKNNAVFVDEQLVKELAESANRAANELGKDGAGIIARQVDDIVSKAATGQIDGQTAYNIKRTLDRISSRNTPEAFYARDLKKALMNALDRSLGPDQAKAFAETRKQYSNMLALENLAPSGAEGGISAARLANTRNIRNADLQEVADIAAQFLKGREGQHGAAQRVSLGGMASLMGLGGVPGAFTALGTGAAAGRGLNAILNSEAARNAVLGESTPILTNRLSELLQQGAYRAAPVLSAQ